MDQQQFSPQSPTPIQNFTTSSGKLPKRRGVLSKVLCVLLVVVLLGGAGFAGFKWQQADKDLKSTKDALQKSEEHVKAMQTSEQILAMRADLQGFAESHHSDCSNVGKLIVFDVMITTDQKFGVMKFVCEGSATKARYMAYKRINNTWEFTYGSSTLRLNDLPSYIYDSDPEYFKGHGAVRF